MNKGSVLYCLFACTISANLSATEVTDTRRSRFASVQATGLSEVQWTDGFWADRLATLQVNGNEIARLEPNKGYIQVRRRWKTGDVVTLELAMPVQLIESHPLVEETRNQLAVKRGPIVYCLESPDLPAEVRVRDLAISPRNEFEVQTDFEPLSGVAVLETTLHHVEAVNWDNRLYRPISRSGSTDHASQAETRAILPVKTRLIPYFAWSNRGESEMSVWIPRID